MNTQISGSAPAFPRPGIPSNWAEGHHAHAGMNLRAYIATKAMAAILGNPNVIEGWDAAGSVMADRVAEKAVAHADALIAELRKEKK